LVTFAWHPSICETEKSHAKAQRRKETERHRREGRETHYRAQPDALAPMVDWLRHYGAFWRDRFDRLEALLERIE